MIARKEQFNQGRPKKRGEITRKNGYEARFGESCDGQGGPCWNVTFGSSSTFPIRDMHYSQVEAILQQVSIERDTKGINGHDRFIELRSQGFGEPSTAASLTSRLS